MSGETHSPCLPLLLLCGPSSVGKSSACLRLAEMLRARGWSVGGVVTLNAEPQRYALDLCEGEQRLLASAEEELAGPRWGRFSFSQETLDWANRLILQAITDDVDLVILDEIGPLELISAGGFLSALQAIQETAPAGLLVVRPELVEALQERSERDTLTWLLTPENRDQVPARIAAWLLDR